MSLNRKIGAAWPRSKSSFGFILTRANRESREGSASPRSAKQMISNANPGAFPSTCAERTTTVKAGSRGHPAPGQTLEQSGRQLSGD
jgi:hypothetical protein